MIRKITLSLMILLTFCGISCADLIYSTANGNIGLIRINSSSDVETPSIQYTGTVSDPLIASFWNSSATNVMMIDRYAKESGDCVYVFSPSDLTKFTYSRDIIGVRGANNATYSENGYSVFLSAGSKIYDVDSSSFNVLNSFDCTNVISNDNYDTEILALTADSSLIHVLASAGNRQKYMRFDGQLKTRVDYFMSADMSAGASAMYTTSNGYPIIGHSEGIDMMNSSSKFYHLFSTDHPVKAICADENGGGFFYATQQQSGDKYINRLSHFSQKDDSLGVTIESATPEIKLLRDNQHREAFAVVAGGKITVCTYRNGKTNVWSYSASELGGTPVGIVAAAVSGYNGNSSSSGCDSVYAGMILLMAIPLMLRKK